MSEFSYNEFRTAAGHSNIFTKNKPEAFDWCDLKNNEDETTLMKTTVTYNEHEERKRCSVFKVLKSNESKFYSWLGVNNIVPIADVSDYPFNYFNNKVVHMCNPHSFDKDVYGEVFLMMSEDRKRSILKIFESFAPPIIKFYNKIGIINNQQYNNNSNYDDKNYSYILEMEDISSMYMFDIKIGTPLCSFGDIDKNEKNYEEYVEKKNLLDTCTRLCGFVNEPKKAPLTEKLNDYLIRQGCCSSDLDNKETLRQFLGANGFTKPFLKGFLATIFDNSLSLMSSFLEQLETLTLLLVDELRYHKLYFCQSSLLLCLSNSLSEDTNNITDVKLYLIDFNHCIDRLEGYDKLKNWTRRQKYHDKLHNDDCETTCSSSSSNKQPSNNESTIEPNYELEKSLKFLKKVMIELITEEKKSSH